MPPHNRLPPAVAFERAFPRWGAEDRSRAGYERNARYTGIDQQGQVWVYERKWAEGTLIKVRDADVSKLRDALPQGDAVKTPINHGDMVAELLDKKGAWGRYEIMTVAELGQWDQANGRAPSRIALESTNPVVAAKNLEQTAAKIEADIESKPTLERVTATAAPAQSVPAAPPAQDPQKLAGTLLVDRLSGCLDNPARQPGEVEGALNLYYSVGAQSPSHRDRLAALSHGREFNGYPKTIPGVAANMESDFATWKSDPANRRSPAADFVVQHLAANMTAAGVRGLVASMDEGDRKRYAPVLACEHPSLDFGRNLPLRLALDRLPPQEAQAAVKDEESRARVFLVQSFGGPEAAVAAFGGKLGDGGIDGLAAHLVQTREAWLKQTRTVGGSKANADFIAGYMEKHLTREGLTGYVAPMNVPMRKWHDDRAAEVKSIPGRSIPDLPIPPQANREPAPGKPERPGPTTARAGDMDMG